MSTLTIGNVRHDRARLVQMLGVQFRGNACRCPFHDDRHASAGVYQRPDKAWAFKCHVCGINEDVIGVQARMENREINEVFKAYVEPEPPKQKRKPYPTLDDLKRATANLEACYVYANPQTKQPEMVVLRCKVSDGKTFLQARPTDGGFEYGAPPKPWPIYNRARIAAADLVFVVEGEKAVHCLATLGYVATTSPGGAGKSSLADWTPLAGKKVILWPDNDDAGRKHMEDVQRLLEPLGCSIQWANVDVFDLPPKGDVVEYLDQYGAGDVEDARRAILCVIDTAESSGASASLQQRIEDTISGKYSAIPWPWPALSNLSRSLLPGTITLICGDAGTTKSFLLMEAVMAWYEQGVKVAIYELEEDRAYHLYRALALKVGNSRLIDDKWVRGHAEEARAAYAEQQQYMDALGVLMDDAPNDEISPDELLAWVEAKAKAGSRVIAIDPITAASQSARPWEDDRRFVLRSKSIMREYGASLVLVTHPRTATKGEVSIDAMAGGRAYSRFTQSILWVKTQPARDMRVRKVLAGHPVEEMERVNRIVRIGKARNGRGAGQDVGFYFDPNTLRSVERGAIVKEKE